MARSKSQGIGLITSTTKFKDLQGRILNKLKGLGVENGWDSAKKNDFIAYINASTGRSSQEQTITDFYQVMFLTFLPFVHEQMNAVSSTDVTAEQAAKKTNTLIAKLATVGQYGNTGVVRRQTTPEKLKQNLFDRGRVFSQLLFRNYETMSIAFGPPSGITVNNLDDSQLVTAVKTVKEVLNLRPRRTSRRSSTSTRRTTTTPTTTRRASTTPTTTRRTSTTSEADLESALREFNATPVNQKLQEFKYVVKAFRIALRINAGGLTETDKLPLNLVEKAFTLVFVKRVNNVRPRKYLTLKGLLRIIAFCIGGWSPQVAKGLSKVFLFPQGERREFGKARFAAMCFNLFEGITTDSTQVANRIAQIVTDGGGPSENWADVRVKIMRGVQYNSLSEMPTVSQFRTAMRLETAEMVRDASSVTQVRDDNPRSTTPPEASQSRTLVKETPFTGTVGIEIEYYGVSDRVIIEYCKRRGVKVVREGYNHSTRDHWKLVNDVTQGTGGSGEAGELVSPILKGKSGLATMRKCLMAVNEAGMLVNKDGGLHVHFGVQDYSVQTIKNIIVNYHGFQGLIDKMLNPYRRNNQWAKPFSNTQIDRVKRATTMNGIFNAISGRSRGEWTVHDNRDGARYHVVNVFCYLKYGTLEFRQHASNIETDTTLMWVYFLHFLIEASKKKELSNYTWKNLENILPKRIGTFWANRVYELSGGTDQVVRDFTERRKVTNV